MSSSGTSQVDELASDSSILGSPSFSLAAWLFERRTSPFLELDPALPLMGMNLMVAASKKIQGAHSKVSDNHPGPLATDLVLGSSWNELVICNTSNSSSQTFNIVSNTEVKTSRSPLVDSICFDIDTTEPSPVLMRDHFTFSSSIVVTSLFFRDYDPCPRGVPLENDLYKQRVHAQSLRDNDLIQAAQDQLDEVLELLSLRNSENPQADYLERLKLELKILNRSSQDPTSCPCSKVIFSTLELQASEFESPAKFNALKQYVEKYSPIPAVHAKQLQAAQRSPVAPTTSDIEDSTIHVPVPTFIVIDGDDVSVTRGLHNSYQLCTMAVTSTVTFLSSLGITSHPVFGLTTDGRAGALLFAEGATRISRYVTACAPVQLDITNAIDREVLQTLLIGVEDLYQSRAGHVHDSLIEFMKGKPDNEPLKSWTCDEQKDMLSEAKHSLQREINAKPTVSSDV